MKVLYCFIFLYGKEDGERWGLCVGMSGFLNRDSSKAGSGMITNDYLGYWSVLKVLKLLKCAKLESDLKKGKKEPRV